MNLVIDPTTQTIIVSRIPTYIPYFCALARAGSMDWYPTDDNVGGVVTDMDRGVYPQVETAEEIWLVFEASEKIEGGI